MNFFEFGYCSTCIVVWYLMSNYKLIRLKRIILLFPLNCVVSYFCQLHLMFYVCVRRFDVTGTVGKFLGTKQGLTHGYSLHTQKECHFGQDLSETLGI